ncbi:MULTISPECIES: hypothetical protein [Rhizobium]|uniref:Uncharacterized protein n=1 Tax=Rhizobium ruizarguesonis TaxID=2081791 RepID=A0ABY1WW88_9HYPH|nr:MULTISPECIES: hypothetical protein [Rhizobium]RWX08576.1 hypothetical protein EHI45_23650 [Rhizobium leguminosarum]TAX63233.1 hypothetical protein ELH98_38875 [Rhizobium ruizarguesonis]TAY79734.1 hypothetical protein ELH86_12650 [Rhizobium ruizarguesonis]TBC98977.1 hypothetical protein ELH25_09970 [Rhizobium ruizarguesonis]TBD04755.1 hypothetical protein ELH21_10260 [Rhizobium leguminosarum]
MKQEQIYGVSALIVGLFLSVLAWIPFVAIAATLSFEFAIGGELAMVCVLMLFSPAVILFYVSFALLADEVFGYLTGRAVFGMQPGSLKGKIRQIVGSATSNPPG